jgi:hypothetical protein
VRHSYAQRRYTIVCEVSECNWRVCARRQKETGKFKITKIVGPHTCAQTELSSKHRQLTYTLIAKRILGILKGQPNLKVKSIMTMTSELFGYRIKYGKAWRAKQRAWKMIYGDWEEGYEKLPALFNAIKAKKTQACITSTSPNLMNGGTTERYFFVLSGVSRSA